MTSDRLHRTGLPTAPPTFQAVTWNMAGGTPHPPSPAQLEPLLVDELKAGTSLLYLQELYSPAMRAMVRSHGLGVIYVAPQYGLAFDRDTWRLLAGGTLPLAADTYFTTKGHPMSTEAAYAVLADRAGRTLTAASYHLPSAIQAPRPPARRLTAAREAMDSMRKIAKDTHTTATLYGGDDNVDERGPFASRFGFMLGGGLTQVRAPHATHGRSRRIDDFRLAGHLKAGPGSVHDGGGDHRRHRRAFRWLA